MLIVASLEMHKMVCSDISSSLMYSNTVQRGKVEDNQLRAHIAGFDESNQVMKKKNEINTPVLDQRPTSPIASPHGSSSATPPPPVRPRAKEKREACAAKRCCFAVKK